MDATQPKHRPAYSPAWHPGPARKPRTPALAPVDWTILSFQAFLHGRAWLAPDGPEATHARLVTGLLFASAMTLVPLAHGRRGEGREMRCRPVYGLAHRAAPLLPMLGSYLALRRYLPALGPTLVDRELLAIDRYLFTQTPAVLVEPLSRDPAIVEWFAFFYFGYFAFLASHLLGTLLFDRGRRGDELLLSLALSTTVGHALYTVVPGLGPHAQVGLFQHDLVGGPHWDRVQQAVALAGARLDIFPSLHTAHPLVIALHVMRHRGSGLFRWTWPAVWFSACNMIIATMFLRWHYGIDVLAGAALAVAAHHAARALNVGSALPAQLESRAHLKNPRGAFRPGHNPLRRCRTSKSIEDSFRSAPCIGPRLARNSLTAIFEMCSRAPRKRCRLALERHRPHRIPR